jgi:hypothetical protein
MIHIHWHSITHHNSQRASDCESSCVIQSQWLWIMVCYAVPVDVNHGVLRWARGMESWWVILSLLVWIMMFYAERMVVHHVVLFWANGCHTMIHSQWLSITHNVSGPLAQHNTQCFTTIGFAYNTMIHSHLLSTAHNVSETHAAHNAQCFTTIGSA